MADWFAITNADELDTPALVVYPDRIQKNLEIVKGFIDDIRRLRPHVKTNKTPEVVRMMIAAGIEKLKCATIAEAEMLALEKVSDILLAYQPVGPKAKRFCELQKKFPNVTFSCLVDHSSALEHLSEMSRNAGVETRVYIDLNIGMNRTGVKPGPDAIALVRKVLESPGIVFAGLHAYDGHLRDPDFETREKKCNEAFAPVQEMRLAIQQITGKYPLLVAGGTPSFPIHAKKSDREASPGTFILWDRGYNQILKEQPFEFAALVVTRVISVPSETTMCVDLGHKSIASENPITNRVYFLNAPDLTPIGHSEEHMVLQTTQPHGYKPGDVLYGVPYHICPTVALYEEMSVCRNNRFDGVWEIASRKRRITV